MKSRAHGLLKEYGPKLGRPHADTLDDSEHANMKELRFKAAGGVWRVTYAFDPKGDGILLATGNKSGVSEKRFYKLWHIDCESFSVSSAAILRARSRQLPVPPLPLQMDVNSDRESPPPGFSAYSNQHWRGSGEHQSRL